MVICPVSRKVDGKGPADLGKASIFFSWGLGRGMWEQQGTSRRERGRPSVTPLRPLWTEMNAVFDNSLKNWGKAGGEPSTSSTPWWGSVEILRWSLDWPTSAHLFREPLHHHSQGWLSFQVGPRGGHHYCLNFLKCRTKFPVAQLPWCRVQILNSCLGLNTRWVLPSPTPKEQALIST